MQFQWLDDVLVLLEEGNMSRAAARRNITQPAFSRRIRGFEDWLGVTVLDRQKNRVEISEALISNEAEIRALLSRLRGLRTKFAQFEKTGMMVELASQHAPACAAFPDMALRAKRDFPSLQFRLRAGNLNECVSLFLRGDVSMLLTYEQDGASALQFGAEIQRGVWGKDYLVPVVGGSLRYTVTDSGEIPTDTPAIVFPSDSYFGEVLKKGNRPFSTPSSSVNTFSVSAFSSSTRELVLKGLGVGWLPLSMAYRAIESGDLISLASRYGQEALQVAIYADKKVEIAKALMEIWAKEG